MPDFFSEKGIEITIEELDHGAEKILEALEYLEKEPYVKVGILASAGAHKQKGQAGKAKSVAEIAEIHEYGAEYEGRGGVTVVIPQRSFITSTMNETEDDLHEKTAKIFDKVLGGQVEPKEGLEILGLEIQKNIKAKIGSDELQELAESTKRAKIRAGKSGDRPLIDTGQLRNSVQYLVVDNGEGDEGHDEEEGEH